MIPESRLIKSELIIRDMSLPNDVLLARKSLVRWIALSLGLILPNESRTLLLGVLDALLYFHVKKEMPTTADILSRLSSENHEAGKSASSFQSPAGLQNGKPANPKAVYYHLLRLKESGLISRKKGRYYFSEEEGRNLPELFRELYLRKADGAFSNISLALKKLEDSYNL